MLETRERTRLGDGDSNGTNPNESFVSLPAQYSVTGQTLHYDPSVAANTISASGGTSTNNFLQRYYGGSLAACRDANYCKLLQHRSFGPGMCGWNNSIAYRGDTQNTEFNALQVTLAQQFSHGLAITGNYQWANAFGDTSNLWTWSHTLTHLRDSQVRAQQLTVYGSYDLPFGKGKQYAQNVNGLTDAIIGGWQLSFVTNWSGGLPYTASFNECSQNVPDTPNPATSGGCAPNVSGRMKTKLTAPTFAGGKITRSFYTQQIHAHQAARPAQRGDLTNPLTWQQSGSLQTPDLITTATQASTPIVDRRSSIRTWPSPRHSPSMRTSQPSSAWMRSTPSTTSQQVTPAATSSLTRYHHR